jgi:hypothetical protein
MSNKVKVGQIIFVRNSTRSSTCIKEVMVTKVGSIYFTISESKEKFYIDNLKQYTSDNYPPWLKIYLSMDEFNDEKEGEIINFKLKNFFGYRCSLNLDQLRRIKKIVDEVDE